MPHEDIMTIGESRFLDTDQANVVSSYTCCNDVTVAVTAALTGTLTLLDGDGNTKLTVSPGQSGVFTIAGPCYRLNYQLSSSADIGLVIAAYHPT